MKINEPEGIATPIGDDDEFMTMGSAIQIITAVVTNIGCQIGSDKVFEVLEKIIEIKPHLVKMIVDMKAMMNRQLPGMGHFS